MSNLSNLLNGDTASLADPVVYESMTETQMSHLMQIALEDAALEELTESLATDEGNEAMFEGALPEDVAVLEKTIVRMDKAAKKQRAYKLAIFQCAKDDGNKDYGKLETLWRMEKYLTRRLEKKYAARAKSRMKQTASKSKAKGGLMTKAKAKLNGPHLTRSQKETQRAFAGQTKPPTQVKSQFNSISQKLAGKIK